MTNETRSSPRILRVLYLHGTPKAGGSSSSLLQLLRRLPANEVEALVLCSKGTAVEAFRDAGISVHPMPGVFQPAGMAAAPLRGLRWLLLLRKLWNLRAVPTILRAIWGFRPHLVHVNERVLLPALLARISRVPVVVHARSVADRSRRRLHRLYCAALNSLAAEVIAIDGSVRHSLREVHRCSIIYNSYSSSTASVVRRSRPPDGRVRITFASILYPAKGVTNLLEAAKLLRSHRGLRFQIAGSNVRPDSFYRSLRGRLLCALGLTADSVAEIRETIEEFSLHETVRLMGFVEDLPTLYAGTDILVVPGPSNGPPRSVFEAGLHGVPSVVCLRDRIEDVVQDGVTGLIVPPNEPEALAGALQTLVDNEELRLRLGRQARAKFSRQFDGRVAARQVLSLYRRLTSLPSGPTGPDTGG